MARYKVEMQVEDRLPTSVEKKLRQVFGKDVPIHTTEKLTTPESRADRLSEAENEFENAKSVVIELRDEMQNWFDSIPENLQNGSKADEVQEAIDALETLEGEMDCIDFSSVSFPSMF